MLLSFGGTFSACRSTGHWDYMGGETRLVAVEEAPSFTHFRYRRRAVRALLFYILLGPWRSGSTEPALRYS